MASGESRPHFEILAFEVCNSPSLNVIFVIVRKNLFSEKTAATAAIAVMTQLIKYKR